MSNYDNVATRNRKAKQEALRDYLESRGLIQHIFELLEKIEDESTDVDANKLARYKTGIDTRLKLVAKYLPDLKQTELIGDPDQPVSVSPIQWTIQPVKPVNAEDTKG